MVESDHVVLFPQRKRNIKQRAHYGPMLPIFFRSVKSHGIHINARLSGWKSFGLAVRIKRREILARCTYKLGGVIDRQCKCTF